MAKRSRHLIQYLLPLVLAGCSSEKRVEVLLPDGFEFRPDLAPTKRLPVTPDGSPDSGADAVKILTQMRVDPGNGLAAEITLADLAADSPQATVVPTWTHDAQGSGRLTFAITGAVAVGQAGLAGGVKAGHQELVEYQLSRSAPQATLSYTLSAERLFDQGEATVGSKEKVLLFYGEILAPDRLVVWKSAATSGELGFSVFANQKAELAVAEERDYSLRACAMRRRRQDIAGVALNKGSMFVKATDGVVPVARTFKPSELNKLRVSRGGHIYRLRDEYREHLSAEGVSLHYAGVVNVRQVSYSVENLDAQVSSIGKLAAAGVLEALGEMRASLAVVVRGVRDLGGPEGVIAQTTQVMASLDEGLEAASKGAFSTEIAEGLKRRVSGLTRAVEGWIGEPGDVDLTVEIRPGSTVGTGITYILVSLNESNGQPVDQVTVNLGLGNSPKQAHFVIPKGSARRRLELIVTDANGNVAGHSGATNGTFQLSGSQLVLLERGEEVANELTQASVGSLSFGWTARLKQQPIGGYLLPVGQGVEIAHGGKQLLGVLSSPALRLGSVVTLRVQGPAQMAPPWPTGIRDDERHYSARIRVNGYVVFECTQRRESTGGWNVDGQLEVVVKEEGKLPLEMSAEGVWHNTGANVGVRLGAGFKIDPVSVRRGE